MKTKTWMLVTLVCLAWLALSGAAEAQTTAGDELGVGVCVCGFDLDGANICFQDALCSDLDTCDDQNPCSAGFTCLVDSCCGVPVCAPNCPEGADCDNPGICGTYEVCMAGVPTLPGTAAAVLGLLLVGLGSLILWRRRVSTG